MSSRPVTEAAVGAAVTAVGAAITAVGAAIAAVGAAIAAVGAAVTAAAGAVTTAAGAGGETTSSNVYFRHRCSLTNNRPATRRMTGRRRRPVF
jgi:hypothetical protein